jgi:hypothetical protein
VLLLATFVLLATVLLAARRKRQALSRRIESMWPEKMRSPQLSVGDACDRSGVALGLGGGGGILAAILIWGKFYGGPQCLVLFL